MSKIGRYEVEAEIGRGAMGVVYLAHDPRLRRRVAVKTYSMPDGLSPKEKREFQERFLREAQAAARLSHPGIVTVYDSQEDHELGIPFIAMEYVPGRSLRERLEAEGPIEPDRALEIAGGLADALHGAHHAGIVHRDLKPGNILLRESDGAAKIADFGIARLSTSSLTQSGATLGSPSYMSPEQIKGRALDGRSDLFSLAVMLYEMLCGERPFSGEDLPALAYSVAHETPVPITKRVPELSRGFDVFFDRALAKDPADRFPDGATFKEELEKTGRGARDGGVEATLMQLPRLEVGHSKEAPLAEPFRAVPPPAGWELERRSPRLRLPLLGAALVLTMVTGGWWLWGGANGEAMGDAYLRVDAKSSVRSGTVTLLVDGRKVYSRKLSLKDDKDNKGKRGMRLLKKVAGIGQEEFEARIDVEPGRHEVAARLTSDGEDSEHRDVVVVDLDAGETRRLRLTAGRVFGAPISLKLN